MKNNNAEWEKIDLPWLEHEAFATLIDKKINILDILDKFNIEYINSHTGKFSHKLRCPFPIHSSGNERTASMFICAENNSFYCFGCNSSGSPANFVMKMLGCPFYEALKWLAKLVGINTCEDVDFNDVSITRERRDPEKTVVFHAHRTGVIIRDHLKNKKNSEDYNRWQVWADKRFKKIDHFLDTLGDDKWEEASKYYDKIKLIIDRNR